MKPSAERLRASELPGLTIDAIVDRLSHHPLVRGVAFIGSTATGRNAASDYDLLVVVDQDPLVLRTGAATAGGALADFVFTTPGEVRPLRDAPTDPLALDTWPERIRYWLSSARPLHDPDGLLAAAIQALNGRTANLTVDPFAIRRRWDNANYNLVHNRRYATSPDALYRDAFALRMTYSLADIMTGYFAARGIPWRGEKAAIHHWETHDPEFKRLFFDCLTESDPGQRVERYAELVRLTFLPVGDPWAADAHGPGPATPADLEPATALWNGLIGAAPST